MDNKQFKPFLEWMIKNKESYEVARVERDIRYNNITAMWGYLLEFFESVGINIYTDAEDCYLIYNTNERYEDFDKCRIDSEDYDSRLEVQTEAIKKALEILKNE